MARQRPEDARTGWKSRRANKRGARSRLTPEERAQANAARAALIASMQGAETDFNPGVAAGGDYVSALTDEDLAAYYHQLIGKKPHHKLKRPAIEKAVREAEAKRGAAPPAEPVEEDLELGGEDIAEDDDQ